MTGAKRRPLIGWTPGVWATSDAARITASAPPPRTRVVRHRMRLRIATSSIVRPPVLVQGTSGGSSWKGGSLRGDGQRLRSEDGIRVAAEAAPQKAAVSGLPQKAGRNEIGR